MSVSKEDTPLLLKENTNSNNSNGEVEDVEGQQRRLQQKQNLKKYNTNNTHIGAGGNNNVDDDDDGSWDGDVGCDERDLFYRPYSLCTWSKNELKYAWTLAVVVASMMVIIWMILHSSSALSYLSMKNSISKPTKHSSTATSWAKTSTSTAESLEAKFNSTNYVVKNNKPYKLVERQVGNSFFDHYMFYNGADSEGSGGYQVYVSQDKAKELGIYNVTTEMVVIDESMPPKQQEYVIMKSTSIVTTTTAKSKSTASTAMAAGGNGDGDDKTGGMKKEEHKRASIRLEGKRRYNHGLFVLDLDHMPAGPGVWPAFWMTDEAHWPDNGEIDILESINNQTQAKTALHTGGQCRMYGQVPARFMTGSWDRASTFGCRFLEEFFGLICLPQFDTIMIGWTLIFLTKCFYHVDSLSALSSQLGFLIHQRIRLTSLRILKLMIVGI